MNINNLTPGRIKVIDPYSHKREIELTREEETTVIKTIDRLKQTNIDTNKLFKLFGDWQTKRTLTTKRIFVSTSLLVTAATWIGIDYTKISILGLNISSGSPTKFIIFIVLAILFSGAFYEMSRRIDLSVKNATIIQLSEDLKDLKELVGSTSFIIKNRNIESFRKLFYDFQPNTLNQEKPPTNAFNAVNFYYSNLAKSNISQQFIAKLELLVIYGLSVFSIVALVFALVNIHLNNV